MLCSLWLRSLLWLQNKNTAAKTQRRKATIVFLSVFATLQQNSLEHKMNRKLKLLVFIPCFLFILFLLLNLIFPVKVNVPYAQVVSATDGKVLHSFLSKDEKWRMEVQLNEVSPQLKLS